MTDAEIKRYVDQKIELIRKQLLAEIRKAMRQN